MKERVAIVGTPCQILASEKINKYKNEIIDKESANKNKESIAKNEEIAIDFKVSLFCMENFSYRSLKSYLKDSNIEMDEIREFRIDKGNFQVFLKNGSLFDVDLSKEILFKRKNCDICTDYTGNFSDISIGSVASPEGWSTVIIRSKKAKKIIEEMEKENYIKTKKIITNGKKVLENVASNKINKNLENIEKRESISRPVLYKRNVNDDEVRELSSECSFENLESDIITQGGCVLCGACEYICPIDIIKIDNRRPQKFGDCLEECSNCFFVCPRTFLSKEIVKNNFKSYLGNYLDILLVKSNKIKGQDGGAVTTLLVYLLEKKMVDSVFVVKEDEKMPWKPKSILTNDIGEVIKSAGTKYSTVPIVFKALHEL